MTKMLQLPAYPTGRPLWIDPNRVGAILDAIEARPGAIVGAEPQLAIVGTSLVIDGATVTIAGEACDVFEAIQAARLPALFGTH